MTTNDTRRTFLLIGATSIITFAIPKLAFGGDPDERPIKKPRKTKKAKSKKLTKSEKREIERELKTCKESVITVSRSIHSNKADIKIADLYIRDGTKFRIKAEKDAKSKNRKTRNLRSTLRRGKNADGSKMSLKQKDDLVSEINVLNGEVSKHEKNANELADALKKNRKFKATAKRELGTNQRSLQNLNTKCASLEAELKAGR